MLADYNSDYTLQQPYNLHFSYIYTNLCRNKAPRKQGHQSDTHISSCVNKQLFTEYGIQEISQFHTTLTMVD